MAHVLLVDDDLILLRVLQFWLRESGYTVTTHTLGADALAALRHQVYDLIILDRMLPDIDGLELCRQIRQTTPTPILLLSAADVATHQDAALAAGADACLGKPVNPDTLLAQVATLVAGGRSGVGRSDA
jgi:DNA-binding response OmpR family regulator